MKEHELLPPIPEENPFAISEDVEYSSARRSGSNSALVSQLFQQVKKLTVDKKVSVAIPITIAKETKEADSLVTAVRNLIAKDETLKDFTIAMKKFKDAEKRYIGSRIWRLS